MKTIQRILTLLALFGFVVPHCEAQIQIASSVFGNGGNRITGENNQIAGTAGQAAIGVSTSANNSTQAGFWYQTVDLITSVEQITDDGLPKEFRLEQNYPNPFNPITSIRFTLPNASDVSLRVFDLLGREVDTLVDELLPGGQHEVQFDASSLASGIYIYKLESASESLTRTMTLLK